MTRQIASLTLIALLALSAPASAQTLFFDNFNADVQGASTTTLLNWNVSNGTIDVIGDTPTAFFDFYLGNGNYVDLDGSSADAARIETKSSFALAPGNYELSFLLGKNGGSAESMVISVGSAFSTTFSSPAGTIAALTPTSFFFTVPSATTGTIVFDHAGGDNTGLVIDNVRLATVVPEASSLALLAMSGAFGMVVLRRAKK